MLAELWGMPEDDVARMSAENAAWRLRFAVWLIQRRRAGRRFERFLTITV